MLRKLIFNIHLYVAMAAGLFVVILGLTGSIMAFEPEIDHLLHWKLAYVQPGPSALSLAEIGAIASRAFPADRIQGYDLSTSPNLSYQVELEKSGIAYFNQYTGQLLGTLPDQPDFLQYVHGLHTHLLWNRPRSPGKKIMGWAGVAMLFLAASGLYLWWPVKRVTIRTGATGRRWWFDLHNAVGIFSLVFLCVLSFTGVLIGFEETTEPMLYKITGSQPSRQPKVPAPPADAQPISPDQAVAIARLAIPGAAPFAVNIPGPKGAYQVRLRFPEDRTPGGRSRVIVDQYDGKILFAEGSRTAPAGARIINANRALHTGDILGIPSKALLSLASLMAVVQIVSGLVMWWKRVRKLRTVQEHVQTARA